MGREVDLRSYLKFQSSDFKFQIPDPKIQEHRFQIQEHGFKSTDSRFQPARSRIRKPSTQTPTTISTVTRYQVSSFPLQAGQRILAKLTFRSQLGHFIPVFLETSFETNRRATHGRLMSNVQRPKSRIDSGLWTLDIGRWTAVDT